MKTGIRFRRLRKETLCDRENWNIHVIYRYQCLLYTDSVVCGTVDTSDKRGGGVMRVHSNLGPVLPQYLGFNRLFT